MKTKKGLSTRQLKRKLGVNPSEIFSAYEQFKTHIEGNVLKEVELIQDRELSVKELVTELKGKLKDLDSKMFEMKMENHSLQFETKNIKKENPEIKIHYTAKKHTP